MKKKTKKGISAVPEMVSLAELKSHEQIRPRRYRELKRLMKKSRSVSPILVDRNSKVILDGHHRTNVMRSLGYEHIPAFLVDYSSKEIRVFPRRKKIPVSKKSVVEHGLAGNPYPPKTTRHVIKKITNSNTRICLDEIEKTAKGRILRFIGRTPLVEIRKINPNPAVRIFAKLEGFNPGGSVKDRPAMKMIEDAEKSGKLTKEKIIIEPTSGNTGIAIAMISAVKGYSFTAVMPESASMERRQLLKAYGAQVILTAAEKGTDGAIEKAREMAKQNPEKYFMPDQFSNPSNIRAHYEGTAEEILRQTNGKIDAFVAGMGTTGTLVGAGRRLKEFNKKIKILAVEPEVGHKIQGLKNLEESEVPKICDKTIWDEKIIVKTADAFAVARQLAREEGLLVGMSSGAALWAALQKAKQMKKGNIVVIFPDRGERYLSCGLFD